MEERPTEKTRAGAPGEPAFRPPPRDPAALPDDVAEAAVTPKNHLGKYVLVRELGKGGMGVVHLAWQSDLRRYVAIKLIRGVDSEEDVARFKREAQIVAQLQHPNIIPVYEIGDHEERPYMVMMYIEGRTLDRMLKSSDRPPVRRLLEWLGEAARAVEHAHAKEVIHRDLKPSNLIVDASGRVYVMDFGLARQVQRGSGTSMTLSGVVVGTPSYMSPEQAEGRTRRIGAHSDVYSLGATMYEMLTGEPPHRGDSAMEILHSVALNEPRTPRALNPKIHADLETICLKAMDRDMARRYRSAGAFADDLRRWLDGEPIEARPLSGFGRLVRSAKRHRLAAASLAVAAMALLAAAVTAVVTTGRLQRRAAAQRELDEATKRRYELETTEDEGIRRAIAGECEAAVRRALAIDPSHAEAHAELGAALSHLQRPPEEVLAAFERAAAADPSCARAYLLRSGHLMDRYDGARPLPHVTYRPDGEPSLSGRPPETAPLKDLRTRIASDYEAYARLGKGAAATEEAFQLARWRSFLATTSGDYPAAIRELQAARRMRVPTAAVDFDLANLLTLSGDVAGAVAAAHEGLRKRPRHAKLLALVAILRYVAEAWTAAHEDEFTSLRDAMDRALEVEPGAMHVRRARGALHVNWASWRSDRGLDPTPLMEIAERELRRVIEAIPEDASALDKLGTLRYYQARRAVDTGADPAGAIREALELFDRSRAADPAGIAAAQGRLVARGWHLELRGDAGEDVQRELDLALAEARALADTQPDEQSAQGMVGRIGEYVVRAGRRAGRDVLPLLEELTGHTARMAARWPKNADAASQHGYLLLQKAEVLTARRSDPTETLALARDALEAALRIRPASILIAIRRATADFDEATWLHSAGRPAQAHFDSAERRLADAAKRAPDDRQLLRNLGHCRMSMAIIASSAGGDIEPHLRRAEEAYDRLVSLFPLDARSRHDRGKARAMRIHDALVRRQDLREGIDAALADLRQAAQLAPNDPEIRATCGQCLYEVAMLAGRRGDDPRKTLEEARTHLEAAVERAPRMSTAIVNLGSVYYFLDEREKCVRAWERAIEVDPGLERELRQRIRQARGE